MRRLFPHLQFASEVVVVDSGSQDQTKELVDSYGFRYFDRTFDGYGPQKIFAVNQAQYPWVLNLDADEIPSPQLIESLHNLFSQGPGQEAYNFLRQDVFLGRPMRTLTRKGHHILRLFKKEKANFTPAQVHEIVDYAGTVGNIEGVLWHYSYPTIHLYFAKFNQYTTRAANEMPLRKPVSSIWILLKVLFKFISYYVIQGNFLNGYPGLVWSLFSSWYVGVKLVKYNERFKV